LLVYDHNLHSIIGAVLRVTVLFGEMQR
jgi:hypothetical protein